MSINEETLKQVAYMHRVLKDKIQAIETSEDDYPLENYEKMKNTIEGLHEIIIQSYGKVYCD